MRNIEEKVNSYNRLYLWDDMQKMGYMFDNCKKMIDNLFGVEVDEIKFLTAYMGSLNREAMEQGEPRLCSQATETTLEMFVNINLKGDLGPFIGSTDYDFEDKQMYWVGYMYAYLHYHEDIKSRDLVKILPIEDMLHLYITGHQMSESAVYNRIKWKFKGR